jgi:magnesium transporter
MPLTLLVGWYGMNLKMPEYQSNIAYPIVAAASLLVFVGGIIYFKKKKWL